MIKFEKKKFIFLAMSSLPSSSLLLKLPTVKITNMISDYLLECVCASLNTNKKKGAVGRSYRAKKKSPFQSSGTSSFSFWGRVQGTSFFNEIISYEKQLSCNRQEKHERCLPTHMLEFMSYD